MVKSIQNETFAEAEVVKNKYHWFQFILFTIIYLKAPITDRARFNTIWLTIPSVKQKIKIRKQDSIPVGTKVKVAYNSKAPSECRLIDYYS